MRDADTVLGIIRERGTRGLPLEDLYRQLFNPQLYLRAYGRIAGNAGALTPGTTPETVDGMSLAKIEAIIEALRFERYRWTPVRRAYIAKPNSTTRRPLGIPTWSDKLLQEVIRMLLEAYYEPQFSDHSHGFRPHRGCHTALTTIYHRWVGTKWFVEGDIKGCFDSIDHAVLLAILREKVHDGRFVRLIANLLEAGYLEDWHYHATLSGSPQGGVVSPLLANIYLDRLDTFVATTLLPAYNRGTTRRVNPAYARLQSRRQRLDRQGRHEEARALRTQYQRLPSFDPTDPDYRRLQYVRYADDVLLGFVGPRHEAEAIKRQLNDFLRDELKLELSDEKTLITHATTQAARFLGYEIVVLNDDTKRDWRGHRSINGQIGLKVPLTVVRDAGRRYLRRGKPVHRPALLYNSVYDIVVQYQAEFRGLVQYYRLAYNLHQLNRLKWVMEQSLTKTLACKLRVTVTTVYERYGTTLASADGRTPGLKVTVERGDGKRSPVALWGGIPLRRQMHAILDDHPPPVYAGHTELVQRLLADTCELCGSQHDVQVHHVRALKDLRRPGRAERPAWVSVMAARRRKTLVVCHTCHVAIHTGRPHGGHTTG
jgi:group II intron reverse transcriptase/maturase